jgi:uncharacterized protein YoxC
MAKFIIEIRSKGFTNAKKRIDETTVSLRKQALQAKTTRGAMKKLNVAYQGMNLAMSRFRNSILLATFALTPFILAIQKLRSVTPAAELEDLTRGFNSLRVNAGLSARTLERLTAATDGTVTRMELMRQANNAMLLGVARSTEELAQLFDAAQQLGRALGKDATSSIESLVTGLGRQSRLMLDNVGIMIKVNEAYEEFAKQNNTTVAAMTDTEKKTAFLNSGLGQALEKIKAFGIETISSSDKIRQTNVALVTLSETVSQAVRPQFLSWSKDLKTVAMFLTDYVKEIDSATFKHDELQQTAHTLKMEIAKLKLEEAGLITETKELTAEEIKLKEAQEQRVAALKLAIIGSNNLLGVEKEMLKERLGLRDAISQEEMALLSLLDTQSLSLKLQGKETEFLRAQIEIKERQSEMILAKEEQDGIARLKLLAELNDQLRALNLQWVEGQLQIISDFEDEQSRIHRKAAEELAAMQAEADADGNRKQKQNLDDIKDKATTAAAAVTTLASGIQAMGRSGASQEDKMKALLQTLGQLAMIAVPGGGGKLLGAGISAMAGFIGHTGGLIQNNGIQRFATGGMVQGQDNVPIMAQAGEFVMRRSAVNQIGLQNLAQMNQTGQPSGGLTINIAGDMVGDEDHVRTKVLPAIREELRREANV